MLTKLRISSKNSFIKIVLGTLLTVLILSFAMWGTEDLVGVNTKKSSVATVGDIDVSSREFFSLYSRQTEEIRKLLGQSLDIEKGRQFGYVDRALSSLINRALFNNEANQLGLSVSDLNVRDRIIKDDSFKDDLGQFSELIFRQLISESGYNEDSYIQGTRQDLAREQMVDTIRSGLKLPNVIQENLARYNMEERTVDYFSLIIDDIKVTTPSKDELKNEFDNNKDLYMTNEFREVETLLLDAKKYAETITVTEDEITLLYEERRDELVKPERRYIKQILTESQTDAKKIFEELNNKKTFENVAIKFTSQSKEDIDLGWNTRDELPDEIVKDIFKLSKNEISKPIKSSFGWHIVQVKDIDEREELTFENVKNAIKKELLLEKGKEAVYDMQDEVEDFLSSGDTLKEISEKLDIKLIFASSIDKEGKNIDGTTNDDYQDERILRSVFSQKENEEGNLIDIDKDEGLAISIVTKIIPSRQMKFKEAEMQLIKNVKKNKKFELAKIKANQIKNVINETSIEQASKKFDLDLRGVSPFNRIQPDDSEIPLPLISDIFKSKLKDVLIHNKGKEEILIAQVASIEDAYNKEKKTDIKDFSKRIEDDMSIDLLAQFSEILRQKYKISINDDVIDSLN
tara:strand:- start:607 stop:2496 length:1890 start_codon:yes stop_codon:yes gene_type:complete